MYDTPVEISIVVPVYNSAQTLQQFFERVDKVMRTSELSYELILSDDCSSDDSWLEISKICEANKQVIGLRLAKNAGQWFSTIAGISKALGKYIITIDDDMEYDPDDIPNLYKTITTSNYLVVFGMAKDKYALQGKSPRLSNWRNRFLNVIWNKLPTDSFKIFERKLVFDGNRFLLRVPFEVFITRHLPGKFWGYCAVRFNKRVIGHSNHSFIGKIRLFFLYSSYLAGFVPGTPYSITETIRGLHV